MGKKQTSSNALAVQLDAEGKIKYDAIARQGHGKDKVSSFLFCFHSVLILILTAMFFSDIPWVGRET